MNALMQSLRLREESPHLESPQGLPQLQVPQREQLPCQH
jgi:hypothetical protein